MHNFDPLTIPLKGQQLVEASAGTGKTFSIAQLYLRFIVEGGLDVNEILVVTFTTSATDELRQRIRARLREALDVLLQAGEGEFDSGDNVLKMMLSKLHDRPGTIHRLTGAIARLDESAVFTIHSFCQKVLQDNAFESGSEFTTEFIESEQQLRLEIIQDFWRQRFYSAPAAETAWAAVTWKDPLELMQVLSPILAHAEVTCIPEVTDEEMYAVQEEMDRCFLAVKEAWQKDAKEITELLKKDSSLTRNAKSYRTDRLEILLAGMKKLCSMEKAPWLLPECTDLLASSVMEGHIKRNKDAPEHEFFAIFDAFYRINMECTRLARINVLLSAYRFLRVELQKRKQERGQMYFDDLLTRLDRALVVPDGAELVHRIRRRYKVALVDEFQDTDPVQYRIFHTLFGKGENPGLFMIGDPKQSIYSFRGADVFAYIQAKNDTLNRSAAFTMGTNYRSAANMIHAVNCLFDRENSFLFGKDISFSPVRPGNRSEREHLTVEGEAPSPLQVMFLPVDAFAAEKKNDISKKRAEKAVSSWTAQEIARLLNLGKMGAARIGREPLSGGDLAVLVRTHREAEMIQQELAGLRIASVYYSQDSVFSCDEARELSQVLTALLDLSDTSRISAALATPLFGMNAPAIEYLMSDAARWEKMIAMLEEDRFLWQRRGVAAMLQNFFNKQRVAQRLIGTQGGERKLTNYIHLAELLEAASEDQFGMDGLVRWFNSQRLNTDPASAIQQLRLESDENLVRIVTVHKAKGLEYPVVFLPFVWSCRSVAPGDVFSFHRNPENDLVIDIGSGEDENIHHAESERLAEDLRLLYVAVTRARYCCYFSWGRINRMERSAMAWLLHRERPEKVPVFADLQEERIVRDLETLNLDERLLDFLPFPDGNRKQTPLISDKEKMIAPRVFQGKIDTGWTINSYSKIVRMSVQVNRAEEVEHEQPYPDRQGPDLDVFSFPRGAAAGTCLHGIFEELDFTDYTDDDLETLVKEQLRIHGLDMKWSRLVCRWVKDVLATPLDAEAKLYLKSLQRNDRLAELGFYFTIERLAPAALDRVLSDFGCMPIEIDEELAGLMKGYIDLVFRFDGRYYLVDYKSNYLGASVTDYHPSKLIEAMESHRYDLQYLIYTVALHRYLSTRIRDYDYDHHFGGVKYLFLRGMHPDHPSGNGIYSTVPSREMIDRLDLCFARTGED